MLHRALLSRFIFSPCALALTLLCGQHLAIAEQANHAAHHEHQHKHHEVAPGVELSEADYPVPGVTMVNQQGEKVLFSELLATDQPVMLNFIFTSCTAICPTMSATFASVQKKLAGDSNKLRMISVSIDPEYDTPDALNAYAKRFKAGPQWQFLTGTQEDSIAVQKAFDADRGDKMNHAPTTLIRATPASQWLRYDGFTDADELAQTVRGMFCSGSQVCANDSSL